MVYNYGKDLILDVPLPAESMFNIFKEGNVMKKTKKIYRRLLGMALALSMVPALLPVFALAEESVHPYAPVVSKTAWNGNSYNSQAWTSPSLHTAELHANEKGGLTRVEYIIQKIDGVNVGKVFVEDYNDNFQIQSSRTIDLPEGWKWGGFYAGKKYNFLVVGRNTADNRNYTDVEVIRVIRYTKDWKESGYISLTDRQTVIWRPFQQGAVQCAEYGDMLYIRTARQILWSHNANHETSFMMWLNQDTMAQDSVGCHAGLGTGMHQGYCSHSMDQYLLVDEGNLRVVALDLGDCYPRGIAAMYYNNPAGSATLRFGAGAATAITAAAGAKGANHTGISIGSFLETKNGYLVSYNNNNRGNGGQNNRYVYVNYITKNPFQSQPRIEVCPDMPSRTPYLAPINTNFGYVVWTKYDTTTTLYYAPYYDGVVTEDNPEGEFRVGEVEAVNAKSFPLAYCPPISYKGKTIWYTTNNSVPTFFTIDEDGNVEEHEATPHAWDEGVRVEPTCKEAGSVTYTCTTSGCSETKTVVLDIIPHEPAKDENGNYIITHDTASEDAESIYTHSYTCRICNEPIEGETCNFGFGKGVVDIAPTCTEKGTRKYTCKRCCFNKYEDIDMIPHVHSTDAETIIHIEGGDDDMHDYLCTVCDQRVDPTSCKFNAGTVIKEATFEEDGEKLFTCTVCGYEKTVILPGGCKYEFASVKLFDAANENEISAVPQNEDFVIKMDINKIRDYDGATNVIAALYDTDGTLISVYPTEKQTESDAYAASIPAQEKAVGSIKLLAWDNFNSMTPLAIAETLSVAE